MRWIFLLMLMIAAVPLSADPGFAAGLRIDDDGRP